MKMFFAGLCCIISLLATGQGGPDTSYRLLWFKGKKLSTTSLLTAKGDTVFYQPSKGLMKFSARKGSTNKLTAMEAELNRTPQRVKEMAARLTTTLPKHVSPFLAEPLGDAFAKVNDEWKELVSTNLQLPEGHLEKPAKIITGKGGASYDFDSDDLETQVDQFINEMQDYLRRCQSDATASIPTPPRADLSYCNECNGEVKTRLDNEIEKFTEAFWGKDQAMMRKVLGVARQLQIMGSAALLTKFYAVYEPFFDYMESRHVQKARALLDKYADDPEYHAAILPLVLSMERQRQLFGRVGNGESLMDNLIERVTLAVDAYLKKAAAEFNYPVMLNASFILGAERQQQILGRVKGVDLFQRHIDFNRFKLSVNVSTKFGGVDEKGNYMYIISQLRGDNFFAAMPEKNCKLKWVLMGPDKDHLKYKLETGEISSTMKVDYTGTKDWFTEKPDFNLDFCRSGPDTVIARSFTPVGLQESWVYPDPVGTQHYPNISSSIVTCFTDVDKMREEAAKLNEEKIGRMKKEMMALQQQFTQKTKGLARKDPSKLTPADMAKFAQVLKANDKIMEMAQAPAISNIYVYTKAANRNKIIFKERINGKELFPQLEAIQYAYFHIQLEHDNTSPYKVY